MWKIHAVILLVLCIAVIPVAVVDRVLLAPGGGDWITLDFRGLLLKAYVIWLVIHAALTTVALASRHVKNLFLVHGIGALFSIVVFVGFVALYLFLDGQSKDREEQKRTEAALKFSGETKLDRWAVDDLSDPHAVKIDVTCAQGGRVAIWISGLNTADVVIVSGHTESADVGGGQSIELRIPLTRQLEGSVVGWSVHIAFSKATTDISTIYQTKTPAQIYDGMFVYQALPPPSPHF